MPPPSKRRKVAGVEEITYDQDAREDYLSGFHKRKVQRIKRAKEEAVKQDKVLKVEARKQIREQRKIDLEAHVEAVNTILRKAARIENDEESEESGEEESDAEGISGIETSANAPGKGFEDGREDEYVDEDRHTTVTVEPMNLSDSEEGESADVEKGAVDKSGRTISKQPDGKPSKRTWTKEKPDSDKPKKRKKKFRYESKIERKATRSKQRSKQNEAAKARRGE